MKEVEISFIEQSKAVTAKVKVHGTGDVDVDGNNKALAEAKRLFNEAQIFSLNKSVNRVK